MTFKIKVKTLDYLQCSPKHRYLCLHPLKSKSLKGCNFILDCTLSVTYLLGRFLSVVLEKSTRRTAALPFGLWPTELHLVPHAF